MKLENLTPFPASLDTGSTTDHEQVGMLGCRISYQWGEDGELTPLPAPAMWPVATAPQNYEGTLLLPDADYRREGIDVLVFGDAVAPDGQPVQAMRVGVASGAFVRQFDLLGDRHWQRVPAVDGRAGKDESPRWQPSPPEPFVRMPLACDRAFGGQAPFAGAARPYAMNPVGRGYALDVDALEGVPLPNLERTDQRIVRWNDTPVPACFHKPPGGFLLPATGPDSWAEAAADRQLLTRAAMRQSFQQAPPDFVCPRGALGPELVLKGFDAGGLLRIALPPESSSTARGAVGYVEVGALRACVPLRVVALIVLVAQRMLVVSFAAAFRYLMRPGEARRALLRWHGDTAFRLETPS